MRGTDRQTDTQILWVVYVKICKVADDFANIKEPDAPSFPDAPPAYTHRARLMSGGRQAPRLIKLKKPVNICGRKTKPFLLPPPPY